MTRHALPHMKAGGTIINTASINAYQPKPSIIDYGVTKGAIVTFTKGLAQELAKRGIRVNAVAPGPVWTPLIAQSFKPEEVAKFGSNNPMGQARSTRRGGTGLCLPRFGRQPIRQRRGPGRDRRRNSGEDDWARPGISRPWRRRCANQCMRRRLLRVIRRSY